MVPLRWIVVEPGAAFIESPATAVTRIASRVAEQRTELPPFDSSRPAQALTVGRSGPGPAGSDATSPRGAARVARTRHGRREPHLLGFGEISRYVITLLHGGLVRYNIAILPV